MCNELYENWAFDAVCRFLKRAGTTASRWRRLRSRRESPTSRANARRAARAGGARGSRDHRPALAARRDGGLYLTSPDAAVRANTADYIGELAEATRDLGGDLMVFGSPKQRSLLPVCRASRRSTGRCGGLQERHASRRRLRRHHLHGAVVAGGNRLHQHLRRSERADRRGRAPQLSLHLDVKAMYSESTPVTELIRQRTGRIAHHFHANDANRRGPGFGDVDFVADLRGAAARADTRAGSRSKCSTTSPTRKRSRRRASNT